MQKPLNDGAQSCLQVAHNLLLAKAPRHRTTLARFSALRCLSLLNVEYLQAAEVSQ